MHIEFRLVNQGPMSCRVNPISQQRSHFNLLPTSRSFNNNNNNKQDTFTDVCGVKLEQALSRYFALMSPCASAVSTHPTAPRLRPLSGFHSYPFASSLTTTTTTTTTVVAMRVDAMAPANAIQFRYVANANSTPIVLGDFVQSIISIEFALGTSVNVEFHQHRGYMC
jgi:hypothetical protein